MDTLNMAESAGRLYPWSSLSTMSLSRLSRLARFQLAYALPSTNLHSASGQLRQVGLTAHPPLSSV
jgi:hypothetical protein